ncbi:YhcU family protein [Anoxybacillus suryakundensis]
MKSVYVATEEQKQYIHSLIEQFYTCIFPKYFTDDEIDTFQSLGILQFESSTYDGTLKEAFTIISALQSLQAIIEFTSFHRHSADYEQLFQHNIEQLEQHGISFPLTLEHFLHQKDEYISMYIKPVHAWVM